MVAPRSDAYHDVALHWAVLAMLGALALLAAFPLVAERGWALVDPWAARTPTGGLIAVDNTLWGGSVADPAKTDADTAAIRAFNAALHADPRIELSLVPIGDGLTLARKR